MGLAKNALRVVIVSLIASLLFGLVAGTLIRWRLEKPVYYIGAAEPSAAPLIGHAARGEARNG